MIFSARWSTDEPDRAESRRFPPAPSPSLHIFSALESPWRQLPEPAQLRGAAEDKLLPVLGFHHSLPALLSLGAPGTVSPRTGSPHWVLLMPHRLHNSSYSHINVTVHGSVLEFHSCLARQQVLDAVSCSRGCSGGDRAVLCTPGHP